ncbi:plexin repeat-containing domain protein [Ancylostoma ceylanicum]|uniref:Plexin repeat-containing domain protein n=1 Tax=Ancylostoma ceylanicum TaxID=53326 RepID=A0A0D6LF36_9BILA|nr:plexin repeat-containing domain protein [Ancylostoma ceylanicum]
MDCIIRAASAMCKPAKIGAKFGTETDYSLSTSCDRHCYNGVCLNGSCVCSKGWVGSQCDHCYGRIKLTENQSQLIDGPLDYSSSSKCTWVIENEKKSGAPLNIKLENFQTECGWDFVYIYDGDGVYVSARMFKPVDGILFSGEQEVQELSAPSDAHITVILMVYVKTVNVNVCMVSRVLIVKCVYVQKKMKESLDLACTAEFVKAPAALVQPPIMEGGTSSDTCQSPKARSVWDRVPTNNTLAGRASHTSVIIDDAIWSVGGEHFSGVHFEDPVVYNITSRTWTPIAVEGKLKPPARFDHTLVRYKTKLFMFGGVIDRRNITSALWSFDLHSREWKKEGGDNTDLMGDAILVYGGTMWSNSQNNLTDSLMKYDIKHEKWTNLPPSGVQLFLHTATVLNGLMIVVGGNGYNISESRTKQECFSAMVQAYDIACKQWFNISTGASQLRRYGHTAVATSNELYILGGFNGRMLNDVWRFTPAECSSATRPEDCRSLADGVKCVFANHACVKFDPFVSYKQSFLSFVKNESPKSMSECRNTALRQALQVCDEQNDCMSCISEPGCGWCPSGDQCLPNDGECVDGQVMLTTWEKCSLTRDPPPPRPCGMANDCRSCKLLAHCNWYTVEGKPTCIPLEDESEIVMLTTWEKCSLTRDPPPPRPCGMANDCRSCKLLAHCNWYTVEGKPTCIPLEDEKSSNCSAHKTCAECQLSPECGWLDDGSHTGLGNCTQGSAQGPLNPSKNFRPEQWYFIDCPACQCNGHSMCNETRHTLGGIQEVCGECQDNTMGKHCELCAPGYFGDPRNGDHCKHELSVDFIFTFKLKNEDKDKHATEIYLFSIPHKKDTDVTFQISCDGGSQANVALNITSSLFESTPRKMMHNTTCDSKGFRRVYVASDPDYAYGTDANTTFFVRVFNFTTPITIQVSFAQSPPINWVLFFVIFAACFIVLLVVAGLLWMIKLRIEVYRRNQRRIDEIEHMASRPFSSIKLELTNPHCFTATGPVQGPTPLSVEPCSNYKSGIFTLAVRLPTGGRATTPNGTSGLAVASALCQLTPAQLGVLQAPDNSENRNNRKTTLRRYIPFLRARENDAG